jgi:hypothetical protein
MSTTPEHSVPGSARAREPLVVCVLVATAVVVGWVCYRHWAFPHLERHLLGSAFLAARPWLLDLAITMALSLPYALALLVWGHGGGGLVGGALAALGCGAFLWVVYEVFTHVVWGDRAPTDAEGRIYTWVALLGTASLVPWAWGVARRSGRVWMAGLVVAPATAIALHHWQTHSTWWLVHVTFDLGSTTAWTSVAVVYVTPFVVGALACWLVEVSRSRRALPT